MRVLLIGWAALLSSASALTPQNTYQENAQLKADGLRARLQCPDQVEWPVLPAEGREVFKTAVMDSTGKPIYMLPDSMRRDRPDIEIPQYAFYYHPSRERCEPVVVVQAQGNSLGYQAIIGREAGVASEVFFDLLGTESPQGPPDAP